MSDATLADILVVDDKPDNIRLLADILLQHGYQVRKAISGAMALRAAATLPPDLILLDINMPGMDGYEVCSQLKQSDEPQRSVPVIFLSALSDALDKVRAFNVGGADYITKPFRIEEVLARIQNQLALRKLQREREQHNQQLREALSELERTQAELVQKEKMLSLSKLVAGLAHEINNPLSFIASNLQPAREYVETLLRVIALYQQTYPQPTEAIASTLAAVDLDFLERDLRDLFASLERGSQRISDLVQVLRRFAQLDEAPVKAADLHAGLESALTLLQPRLTGDRAITLERDYGDLPLVECRVRDIHQVFFHLLDNALDALAASAQDAPHLLVQTRCEGDRVSIRIRDNGCGMDAATQARIFDPFFSCKASGQGRGLGLSTCYQIAVKQHGGQLTCQSAPGQGSEFTVVLPLRPADAREGGVR